MELKFMYAVFKNGGKQYKVSKNNILNLEKINLPINNKITFNEVLMIVNGKNIILGNPTIKDIKIEAEILDHIRSKKIKIVKFRRRKHSYKCQGHRQYLTKVKIININFKEK